MNTEKETISEVFKPKILEIVNLEHLNAVLIDGGTPLDLWGTGEAKTVENLFDEITNEEARLFINEKGEIERHIETTLVEVIYVAKDVTVYGLKELKQVFNDGSFIERELPTTLEERVKYSESPKDVGINLLSEKLNIDNQDEFMEFRSRTESKPSHNYPGLTTCNTTHPYMAPIDEKDFKPDGYIEIQPDKTCYYIWDFVVG